MMSYFFCIWGFVRNKSVVGLRGADLPTRGVTPTKGAMPTKGAVRRSLCTLDYQEKGRRLRRPFSCHELLIYRSTYLPRKKVAPIWLKLCTPTCHDELFFLYLVICAKQICCGFTECRLAHEGRYAYEQTTMKSALREQSAFVGATPLVGKSALRKPTRDLFCTNHQIQKK